MRPLEDSLRATHLERFGWVIQELFARDQVLLLSVELLLDLARDECFAALDFCFGPAVTAKTFR